MAATPLSGVLGGPLFGALLTLNGVAGVKGWQWVFLAEGLPSVVLGLVTLFYLTDRPAEARWLSLEEREWLTERLRREQAHRDQQYHFTLWQAFASCCLCALRFATAHSPERAALIRPPDHALSGLQAQGDRSGWWRLRQALGALRQAGQQEHQPHQ